MNIFNKIKIFTSSTNIYFYIGFHIIFYFIGRSSFGLAGIFYPGKSKEIFSIPLAWFFLDSTLYNIVFILLLIISLLIRNRIINSILYFLFLISPWILNLFASNQI